MEELELELGTNIWDRPSTSSSSRSDAPTHDLPAAAAATLTDDGVKNRSTGMTGKTIDGAVAKELEAAFVGGLNNVSTSKNKLEVQALSKRTGVSAIKIKRWIHNRTRRGKARSFGSVVQPPSAYKGYMRIALKGLSGEGRIKAMKEAAKEWKKISDDEVLKARYKEMDRKHAQEVMDQLTDNQKRKAADRLMGKAKKIVHDFEHLGYACALIASDGERVLEGYSSMVRSSTQKEMASLIVRDVFSGTEERPECVDRNALRKKVASMLNEKYRQGIPGCKRQTVPYTKMDTFEVEGLPDGVTLKRVSLYDKKTLVELLNHMPSIKFHAMPFQQGPEESNMEMDFNRDGQDEQDQPAIPQEPIPQEPIPLADISESDSDDAPLADLKSKKLPYAGKSSAQQEEKTTRERKKKDKKYYVSRILEKKGDSFKVLWQGYPLARATWEPRDNLPQVLVQNFEQQM